MKLLAAAILIELISCAVIWFDVRSGKVEHADRVVSVHDAAESMGHVDASSNGTTNQELADES